MKNKTGWNTFIKEVKESNKEIVCFGAGTISNFLEPYFVEKGIWNRISFFIDNDRGKEGLSVGESYKIPILTLEKFRRKDFKNFILLITTESYIPIQHQLDKEDNWNDISCYVYIAMNYEIQKQMRQPWDILLRKAECIIPKIIHYCWFGKGEKNSLEKKCINSWKKFCPDYQIIEWNEENYDVNKTKYMQQAFELKKYAYISDYARLDILYQNGGIYLDTDVELLCNIDSLLVEEAFIAHGQWPAVNSGSGIGAIKGNCLIKEILEERKQSGSFIKKDGRLNMTQNGYYESKVLRRHGYITPFLMQYVDKMLVLAPEVMASVSVLREDAFITENTIAIHHCEGSWANAETLLDRKETLESSNESGVKDRWEKKS